VSKHSADENVNALIAGRTRRARLGRLPVRIQACLFDLDGVLTETATLHAEAWKAMFDAYLRERAESTGEPFHSFDAIADYEAYVDGKPRADGVRSFLASRGIELPEGDPHDTGVGSVAGLGNRKNELVLRLIRERGVEAYPGSVRFVRTARERGLRTAVVSASANCRQVLAAAGIEQLFEVRVDGVVLAREHLLGKPAPDSCLAAARALAVAPARAAVFEDAPAGVTAGRSGGFGFVVGVDRVGQAETLRADGADLVVSDLSELLR
jgi:beta-phosphoglucomutase family hydrolase